MTIVFSGIVVVAVALAGALLRSSHGAPVPFVDERGDPLPNSISEKTRVPINGVAQGMFIKGKDVTNPVLLFVHGGPGMPEYWLTACHPTGLEDLFTVVWCEQRGAGLSFNPGIPPATMTKEQFVADALVVTQYLRRRFDTDRIYLMGHSWGSYIGIQVASRHPELFHAYLGVGQVSHQLESEHLAHAYALERYREMGDAAMVRKLEAAPPTDTLPLPAAYESLRDAYMHGIGVGTHP